MRDPPTTTCQAGRAPPEPNSGPFQMTKNGPFGAAASGPFLPALTVQDIRDFLLCEHPGNSEAGRPGEYWKEKGRGVFFLGNHHRGAFVAFSAALPGFLLFDLPTVLFLRGVLLLGGGVLGCFGGGGGMGLFSIPFFPEFSPAPFPHFDFGRLEGERKGEVVPAGNVCGWRSVIHRFLCVSWTPWAWNIRLFQTQLRMCSQV